MGESGFYDHFTYERGMWGLDLRNGTRVDRNKMGAYSTELFTDEAIRIIRRYGRNETRGSPSNPLFMVLNHQTPHTANIFQPYEIPSRYLEKVSHIKDEERRNHAAMVFSLDEAVGRIIEALDEKKV